MPSREEIASIAVSLFQNSLKPLPLIPENAWLGIYRVLMWHEPIHQAGYDFLPHITDTNRLRLSPHALKAKEVNKPNIWQRRAEQVERYLAFHLQVEPPEVKNRLDLLMKHPAFKDQQRQNPLGFAFVELIRYLLECFSPSQYSFISETKAEEYFPGISMPGRSQVPSIDIIALEQGIPRAIVSAKWSLRHDRINDITNECPVYKAAAMRLRNPLKFIVVTNEFDPARLLKLLEDPCLDAVVHPRKEIILEVCGLDGRLKELVDLAEFLASLPSILS